MLRFLLLGLMIYACFATSPIVGLAAIGTMMLLTARAIRS